MYLAWPISIVRKKGGVRFGFRGALMEGSVNGLCSHKNVWTIWTQIEQQPFPLPLGSKTIDTKDKGNQDIWHLIIDKLIDGCQLCDWPKGLKGVTLVITQEADGKGPAGKKLVLRLQSWAFCMWCESCPHCWRRQSPLHVRIDEGDVTTPCQEWWRRWGWGQWIYLSVTTLNTAWGGELLPDFLSFMASKRSKLRFVFLYLPFCSPCSAFCLGNCLGVYENCWVICFLEGFLSVYFTLSGPSQANEYRVCS